MAQKRESNTNVDYSEILNKIFVCLIVLIVLVLVNTIVLICNSSSSGSSNKEPQNSSVTADSTENYDVSMFKQVSLDEALKLFDGKGTSVLYIGRADCSACQAFLPSIQEAQNNLGYTTNYLNLYDTTSSEASSDTLSKFLAKLDVTTTATVGGEKTTGTYGESFWGVTPMFIIIKDGKMADGLLGAYDYDTVVELLQKYDIGK